jgi:hypothetical protein
MTVDSFGGILEGIQDKRSKLLSGKRRPLHVVDESKLEGQDRTESPIGLRRGAFPPVANPKREPV